MLFESYFYGKRKVEYITKTEIEAYLENQIKEHHIPRPQKLRRLPVVLSEYEVERLFNAVTNTKHKVILFTGYAPGLRVSEFVRLRIADIDSQRLQISINNRKEKKDRMVTLSEKLLAVLRAYVKKYIKELPV